LIDEEEVPVVWIQGLRWDSVSYSFVQAYATGLVANEIGVCIVGIGYANAFSDMSVGAVAYGESGSLGDGSCFTPDEFCSANVVIYID